MLHMVPSCSPTPPTHDAHSFDFDLDLLPTSGNEVPCLEFPLPDLDNSSQVPSVGSAYSPCQQVPSPSNSLSPLAHSPTMFSPMDPSANQKSPGGPIRPSGGSGSFSGGPRYGAAMAASPLSSAQSPQSPACRAGGPGNRLSSTDSTKTFSSSGSTSGNYLADSLAEFQELQAKIKFEQDSLSPQQPISSSNSSSFQRETQATLQVKIEPMEFLGGGHGAGPVSGGYSSHPNLADLKRVSMDSNSSGGSNFGMDLASLPPPPAYSEGVRQQQQQQQQQQRQPSCDEAPQPTESQEDDDDNVQVKMEPVLSLAMAQVKNDIDNACRQLGINAGNYWCMMISQTELTMFINNQVLD